MGKKLVELFFPQKLMRRDVSIKKNSDNLDEEAFKKGELVWTTSPGIQMSSKVGPNHEEGFLNSKFFYSNLTKNSKSLKQHYLWTPSSKRHIKYIRITQ